MCVLSPWRFLKSFWNDNGPSGGTTDVIVLQMIGMPEVGPFIEIKCNQLLGSLEGTFVQSFETSLIMNKVGMGM